MVDVGQGERVLMLPMLFLLDLRTADCALHCVLYPSCVVQSRVVN